MWQIGVRAELVAPPRVMQEVIATGPGVAGMVLDGVMDGRRRVPLGRAGRGLRDEERRREAHHRDVIARHRWVVRPARRHVRPIDQLAVLVEARRLFGQGDDRDSAGCDVVVLHTAA